MSNERNYIFFTIFPKKLVVKKFIFMGKAELDEELNKSYDQSVRMFELVIRSDRIVLVKRLSR